MMTFEEFFTKKKIDLPSLQSGEPALFAEFELHFTQMGEKSFDHTKKYWFNTLRRRFPLKAAEKVEKVHIENRLAEQTVADTLAEANQPQAKPQVENRPETAGPDAPKPAAPAGFKPRFKGSLPPKPTDDNIEERSASDKPRQDAGETLPEERPEAVSDKPAAPAGFKPRFKASVTTKPAAEEKPAGPAEGDQFEEKNEPAASETPAPTKPAGFTPRFKAGVTTKKADEAPPELPSETKPDEPVAETPAPTKPAGFTPRFKASAPPKKVEEATVGPAAETPSEEKLETPVQGTESAATPAKPVGFKPRFKSAAPPKQVVEDAPAEQSTEIKANEKQEPAAPEAPAPDAEQPAKPLGFKPRFAARKPPEE